MDDLLKQKYEKELENYQGSLDKLQTDFESKITKLKQKERFITKYLII
ncbi:MAG: hypothetical protein WCK31_02815 [bacterium]